ncbi:hypothetical protein BH09ACT12_BH09ACT12_12030 [soil metagenome]
MNRLRTYVAAAGAAAALIAPVSLLGQASASVPVTPAAAVSAQQPSECRNGDLVATYTNRGAGMGHAYGVIKLTNVSDASCTTRGYGGLSYVGGGDGTQIGAAARRDKGKHPTVVIEPGKAARSKISETTALNYPRKKCHPTPVDGFRVYVPDATRSQYIEHATTGCAKKRVKLISHKPYH